MGTVLTSAAAANSPAVLALNAIRLAAKASGLGRQVFSQGANGLTDAQITLLFRQVLSTVGITLPTYANVTLDMAQIVLAGGTVYTNLEAGKSLLQCANPTVIAANAVVSLLTDLGIMSPEIADATSLATNGFLVIASGGLNILADIGAALALIKCIGDLGNVFGGSSEAAAKDARQNLYSKVNTIMQAQYDYASNQVKAYQSGALNPFDMIGNIAMNSGAVFKNFFPEIAAYFPSWAATTVSGYGRSWGWFGSKEDYEYYSFITLLTTKQQVQSVLVKKYIVEPMNAYIKDRYPSEQISLCAISVLSMIMSTATGQAPVLDFNFDVVSAMQILGLTPAMLGDFYVFQGKFSYDSSPFDPNTQLPYLPSTLPLPELPGPALVTVNGKPQYTQADFKRQNYYYNLKRLQYLFYVSDLYGDIDTLVQNPESLAKLKAWGKVDIQTSWPVPSTDPIIMATQNFEPLNLKLKPQGITITSQPWFDINFIAKPFPSGAMADKYNAFIKQNYSIDMSDYWKCLQTLNTLERSNLYADPENQVMLKSFGDNQKIQDIFDKCYKYVIQKASNVIARKNVANYLGVPARSLTTRLTSDAHLIFKTKGA